LPRVRTNAIVADLAGDLSFISDIPAPRVVLYIGSSIGNMERREADDFLSRLSSRLAPGDALLLGTDLVKDRSTLLAAYNDAAGVTARFNLNLLERINRELGADFNLRRFRHQAIWNARKSRIEMYLVSMTDQEVRMRRLGMRVRFAAGERIHTENSHKYTPAGVRRMLRDAAFKPRHTWTDERNWFAVNWAEKR
jgi:dimethylhistidine N-methyltransferase